MEQDVFNTDRPLLFSIAYRMLGSASDAEDVLQDGWLRYRGADTSAVRSPTAFATTIVTRLCIDRLKSARVTREQYVGQWLPEPVLTSEVAGPDTTLQRAESVTMAFLVLLETLSPEERAVFLLKEIVDYDHAEIAGILGITPEASRQLHHRAKARIAAGRRRVTGTSLEHRAAAERFAQALVSGDASALTTLLAGDVELWTDGGGKVSAARRPIVGRDAVVSFLTGIRRKAIDAGVIRDVLMKIESVNFEPALVVRAGDRLESLFVFETDGEVISGIRVVRNPDKLARINRQLSATRNRTDSA